MKLLKFLLIYGFLNSSVVHAEFNDSDYTQKCVIKTRPVEFEGMMIPGVLFATAWLNPNTSEAPGVKIALLSPADMDSPIEFKVSDVQRFRCLTCDKYLEFTAGKGDDTSRFEYYTLPEPRITISFDGVNLEGKCTAI